MQLKQMLENKNIKLEKLSADVSRHKVFQYPGHELPQVLGHPGSDLHFVTMKSTDSNMRNLITVYVRHPDYADSKYISVTS